MTSGQDFSADSSTAQKNLLSSRSSNVHFLETFVAAVGIKLLVHGFTESTRPENDGDPLLGDLDLQGEITATNPQFLPLIDEMSWLRWRVRMRGYERCYGCLRA
ncbi:hypothetical protein E4T56_gene15773 [Termitomyces sp. T112]|nr:hypothetical protein E4T56_gene15773 [Termitomyces sp. T112]